MTFLSSRTAGTLAALALLTATRSASAAQPMTFYGGSLGPVTCGATPGSADLHVIARNANTTYSVIRLDDLSAVAIGTVTSAFGVADVTGLPAVAVRVTTSDVAYVFLDEYCTSSGNGGLTYPADDGATTVGSRVVFYDVYATGTNNFIAGVSGSPTVTITTTTGTTVMSATPVAAGSAIQPPSLTRGTVYLVTATGGDITVGGATGNAYSVLAAADSRTSSCSNDRASRFFGNVITYTAGGASSTNGAAVFNDGASASTVTATQLIGGTNTYSIAVGAAATTFKTAMAQGVYRFDATQPVALWFGSTQGGLTIDDLGDDIGVMIGRYDAASNTYRLRARSQTQTSRVFARSGSVVAVNGTSTTVTANESFTVAAAQDVVISSTLPFALQTQGDGVADDWGKWLRPLPTTDADNDGVSDRVESPNGSCQSIAPDTDTDGLPDFLDIDSDNDCLTDDNAGEAGGARTNPALPAGAHCSGTAPICAVPAGATVGVCQACNGDFSSGASRACPNATAPLCLGSGACAPCDGNLGSGTAQSCRAATRPICLASGACGPCGGDFGSGGATACSVATAPFCTASGQCVPCDGGFGGGTPEACKAAPTPVCSALGACLACNGSLGSGASLACQLATFPVCAVAGAQAGSCNGCNGDNASGASLPCPTTANPYCVSNGTCGKCGSNADCVGHSLGPTCNVATGACGQACFNDTDCDQTRQWCAGVVCTPKTPNGQPVPSVAPINGQCTPGNGTRVCLSTVCSTVDNLCGHRTGEPCAVADAGVDGGASVSECRSGICASNGACGECQTDADCGNVVSGKVCDDATKLCKNGCRGTGGNECPGQEVCSSATTTIGQCAFPSPDAGSDAGGDDGGSEAGEVDASSGFDATTEAGEGGPATSEAGAGLDDSGVFEGAGISCSASPSPRPLPITFLLGVALAALGFTRRRRR